MKYLVIEEKHLSVKKALTVIRQYYPDVKWPHFKNRQPQFYFPKSELTKENVVRIAKQLGMEVIKNYGVRAVIRY